MSMVLRDKTAGALLIGGAVVALVGLAWAVSGNTWGVAVICLGLVIEVLGPLLHDRRHRQAGEAPHAMWGPDDRNKPSWLKQRSSR